MPLTDNAARRKDARTGETAPKMSHQHFAFLARVLRGAKPELPPEPDAEWEAFAAQWEDDARALASALNATNPNYDRARFLAACGLEEG